MKKKLLILALVVLGSFGATTALRAQIVPVVSAGTDQTIALPTSMVTLVGTATSANGPITAYAWTKVSGGAATITTPATATTTVTGLVQGSYTFRLTATDSTSQSASDDVMITVNPDPADPTVSAGSAQTITLPVSTATLSGSATASTGRTIASYSWTEASGPVTGTITTPTTASTTVTGLTTVGSYVFTLTATDSTGATGTGSVTITVNDHATSNPGATKMQLEINPNGKVNLQGVLLSNTGGVLTIKVWGITFTINTANAKANGSLKDVTKFVAGDLIRVNGMIDPTASTPTINAKLVRDVSAQVSNDQNGNSAGENGHGNKQNSGNKGNKNGHGNN